MLATAPAIDRAETDRSLPQVESDAPARLERPRRESDGPADGASHIPVLPVARASTLWTPATVVSSPEEHDAPHELAVAAPIDRALTSAADTAGVSSSVMPVVERIERMIVDRSQAVREPVEPKRVAPAIVEHLPVQSVIDEPEQSDRAQARPLSIIQSMGAPPAPGAPDAQRVTPARVTPIVERIERIRENSAQDQGDRWNAAQASPATIQVTIGRIEVRATPSPAAPIKRASPAASTMSLEEYLRSRSGDRR